MEQRVPCSAPKQNPHFARGPLPSAFQILAATQSRRGTARALVIPLGSPTASGRRVRRSYRESRSVRRRAAPPRFPQALLRPEYLAGQKSLLIQTAQSQAAATPGDQPCRSVSTAALQEKRTP